MKKIPAVLNNHGESASASASFETGLLSGAAFEGKARWITHGLVKDETASPIFTKTFSVAPDLCGGLPASTKADSSEHGYGLRNMRYITESYGGTLKCSVEDDQFVLRIILVHDSEQFGQKVKTATKL